MNIMLVYTFSCLACASVNDLVFKLFARKERSRGLFVALVGLIGVICFSFLPDKFNGNLPATFIWGIICGFFSITANIMLIESMSFLSAGICSTIYRLNLALVVPMSVLFLNEKLAWTQYAGIALAILAVLFFLPASGKNNEEKVSKQTLLPMVIVIMAAVFRAGMGITCKYGPMQGASINGINFIVEMIWVVCGLLYYLVRERKKCRPDIQICKYGAISGILGAGIMFFMMMALSVGNASIVLSIAQMSFLLTFILSVIFMKEKITMLKLIAIFCGAGAILLLM